MMLTIDLKHMVYAYPTSASDVSSMLSSPLGSLYDERELRRLDEKPSRLNTDEEEIDAPDFTGAACQAAGRWVAR
jgi:hypothetical protein